MPSPSKKTKPSSTRPKPKRATPKRPVSPSKGAAPKRPTTPAKHAKPAKSSPPARPKSAPAKSAPKASPPPVEPLRGDARRHLLSLSFLRDGDEFLARLETDAGQITELKNRSLDQLLTLVAGELEDLLE